MFNDKEKRMIETARICVKNSKAEPLEHLIVKILDEDAAMWLQLEKQLTDEINKITEAAQKRFNTDNADNKNIASNPIRSVEYEKLLQEEITLRRISRMMNKIEFDENFILERNIDNGSDKN